MGLLATFTIPKLLQNIETSQNRAKFREAYSAIYQILNEEWIKGNTSYDAKVLLFSKLNAKKYCNQVIADGCIAGLSSNWGNRPGFVLHNGTLVMISILGYNCTSCTPGIVEIKIDPAPLQNDTGSGALNVRFNQTNQNTTMVFDGQIILPGKMVPYTGDVAIFNNYMSP